MYLRKKRSFFAIMAASCLMLGCGKDNAQPVVMEAAQEATEQEETKQEAPKQEEAEQENNTESAEEQKDEPADPAKEETSDQGESGTNGQFDYKALGATKYSYPETFVLEDDLLWAVQILATESEFNEEFVHGDWWKKDFLDEFIYSMYDGPQYERQINAEGKMMTREQVEYMQYSLTGEYISFEDIDDEIDATQNLYSPMLSYIISDYEYELDGEDVIVTAEADMSRKGDACEYKYNLKVRLRRDEYSCFNGYNVVSIEKEEVVQLQYDDGNKHEFTWYCSGEDYVDNMITGDFYRSEDTIQYGMFVTLTVTEEQKEYILNNSPGVFVVTYDFDENGMSYPIKEITPTSITVKKK